MRWLSRRSAPWQEMDWLSFEEGAGLTYLGLASTDKNTKDSSGTKGRSPFEEEWLLPSSLSPFSRYLHLS